MGLGAGRCKSSAQTNQTLGRRLKKFTSMSSQEHTNAGDGVKTIGRWHDMAARTGVVIFESNDPDAVQR